MKPNDTNDSRYRAAYLGCVLSAGMSARPRPHVVAALVLDMQRAARSAVTYETNRCSHPMTEAQELRGERRIRRPSGPARHRPPSPSAATRAAPALR